MKWKSITGIVSVLFYGYVSAQSDVTIEGRIVDAITDLPIQGVLVYVDSMPYESHTDNNGKYAIVFSDSTSVSGRRLTAHLKGYTDSSVNIKAEKTINQYDFKLIKEYKVDGVVITTKKSTPIVSDVNLETSDLRITSTDMSIVSAIRGGFGAQVEDRGEGVVVRGGVGSETGFFFDGINIVDFFNASAEHERQTSRFPTRVFKNIDYSAGGFSSQYGGYMSAIISMESQDLPVLPFNMDITMSSLSQDVHLMKRYRRSASGVGVSYTDMSLANKLFRNRKSYVTFDMSPKYLSGYFKHTTKFNEYTSLNVYVDYAGSRFDVRHPEEQATKPSDNSTVERLRNHSSFSIITLKHNKLNHNVLFSNAFQSMNNKLQTIKKDFDTHGTNSALCQFQSHLDWRHMFGRVISGTFGYDAIFNKTVLLPSKYSMDKNIALFGEVSIIPFNKFSINGGVRYDYHSVNNESKILPRLQLWYVSGHHSFRYNSGIYSQLPHPQYLITDKGLKSETSFHHVLNYEYNNIRNRNLHVNMALYHKNYRNLVKVKESEINNLGHGYARGVDVYIAHYNVFRGMLSASFSIIDSKRMFRDYLRLAQPTFVSAHYFRIRYINFINKLSTFLNLQYSYSSGKPYVVPGETETDFLSNRLKDYHNMAVTAAYLTKIGDTQTVIALSVDNIFNTQNISGYIFPGNDSTKKVAIHQVFSRMIYLGVTFNFSHKSRREVQRELFGTN